MGLRKFAALALVLIMIMTGFAVFATTTADVQETGEEEGRWGNPANDPIVERALSAKYDGSVITNWWTDITGDGIDEYIAVAQNDFGEYYLVIFELNDGSEYFLYNFTIGYDDATIMDIDGDGVTEILIIDSDGTDSKVVVYDLSTKTVEFTFIADYHSIDWNIVGSNLVLWGYNNSMMYSDARIWVFSLPGYASAWTSSRYPMMDINFFDLNGDGTEELIFYGRWFGISEGYLHVFDLTTYTIVLNTTDIGHWFDTWWEFVDFNNDGAYEIIIHAYYTGNGTWIDFVYSASGWSYLWSGYRGIMIGEYTYEDFDGDGDLDVFLKIWTTSIVWGFVVHDGMTGVVMLNQDIGSPANEFKQMIDDFNYDGVPDILVFNISAINDVRMFRLWDLNAGSMIYNKTLKIAGLLQMTNRDHDGDGVSGFVLKYKWKVNNDYFFNMTFLNLSMFTMVWTVGPFNVGPLGVVDSSWWYYWAEGLHFQIRHRYMNNSATNTSQSTIFSAVDGSIYYQSPIVNGVHDAYSYIGIRDIDYDGVRDLFWRAYWRNHYGAHKNYTWTLVNGSTFTEMFTFSLFMQENAQYGITRNIYLDRDYLQIVVSGENDGKWTRNYTIYDPMNWALTPIYQVTDEVFHNIYGSDIVGDSTPELIDRQAKATYYRWRFYDFDGSTTFTQLHSYIQEPIGGLVDYDYAMDEDHTLFHETGSKKYYNTEDWTLRTELQGPGLYFDNLDLDRDYYYEHLYRIGELTAWGYQYNMYLVELESGYITWESGDLDYLPIWSAWDIEDDNTTELVILRMYFDGTHNWWQVQTNDVNTNFRPDVLADIPDIEIEEDAVDSTLDLDDYVTDDGPLTFTFEGGEDNITFTVNPTTKIVTIEPKADWFGNVTIKCIADDGHWSTYWKFWVNVTPTNDAPVIIDVDSLTPWNGTVNLTATQEIENNYTVYAMDIDGDMLTYSIMNTTMNMTINATTGVLYYNPVPADGMFVLVDVRVDDMNGTATAGNDTVTLNISIDNVPHAPVVDIISHNATNVVEDLITLEATATDVDIPWGDSLTYEWTSDVDGVLGTDLMVADVNLSIGSHNITFKATDSTGLIGEMTIMVNMSDGSVDPEWWTTFDPDKNATGEVDITFYSAVYIVNITDDGTDMTISSFYKFTGLSSEEVIVIHIYTATQMDDDPYTFMPFYEPGTTTTLEITPVDGKWMWEGWNNMTFPIPDPADGTDGDDPPVITYHYAAVGWDNFGHYDIEYLEATEEDPGDPVVTVDPEWWLLGVTDETADEQDNYDETVTVAWTKCEVETTIVDNGDDTTTMTTDYIFEGTCSDEVTVVYIYSGTSIDDADFTYYGMADPEDMMKKVEIDAESGTWSGTYQMELTYPTPEPVTDGGDGDGGDPPKVEIFYLAVGWAPSGYGYDTIKLGDEPTTDGGGGDGGTNGTDGNGTGGNTTDGQDGGDGEGYSSGTFYGLVAAIVILAVIVIILFIAVIIAFARGGGGKDKGEPEEPSEDELPPPPEDGEVAEGEVGPGEEDLPPPEDGEELPEPEDAEPGEEAAPPEEEEPMEELPEEEGDDLLEPAEEEAEGDEDFDLDEEPEAPPEDIEDDLDLDEDADFDLDDEDEPPLD